MVKYSEGSAHMPHVCFFPGQLQLGGVGRITLNLAEEMLHRGVRVDLFLSKRAGPYVSQIPQGVRILEGGGSVKASVWRLARYLRRERPDVLISARPYINLAALIANRLAGGHTKVVATEHTAMVTQNRIRGGMRQRLISLGCRICYPYADHVVAVSGAVAGDVARITGLDPGVIKVIYNPVVTNETERLCAEPVSDEWISSSAAPIVLGVGRLTLQKDFHTLVRAFAEVRREKDVRLVILGEGEDRAELETLVGELDLTESVYLPGYVDNPLSFMALSAVFVLSSRWEGLPTALIEALAAGTSVVSTDCPGGSKEILSGGEFGRLVPVRDVAALANAIGDSLEELPAPERLRERAMRFSAGRATDEYLALVSG